MIDFVAWIGFGLALLVLGAELLVRGGSALAARLGISPLILGLTFVAVGTSAPELAVGIEAALQGNGALAVGNIAGTNTVNLLLILGLSAAIQPLALRLRTIRIDLPVIVLAAILLLLLSLDGQLSLGDGLVLVACGLAFTVAVVVMAHRESATIRAEYKGEFAPGRRLHRRDTIYQFAELTSGIVIIVLGADWLVDGAVGVARLWGVSDAFIGLTVVAIGTSGPELVSTIVATIRRSRDIAIGNLLGSSIYNIFFILGVTCLVPGGNVPVSPELIRIELPVMLAVALLCVPVFLSGRIVSRGEGLLFVGAYLVYLAALIATV